MVVIAGAGDVDHIGMARDFIEERRDNSPANDADIVSAIRSSVNEVWKDYARYSPGPVNLQLLIGTYSNDSISGFWVVNGTAVRKGGVIEARGVGDATFRAIADRFLNFGALSYVVGDPEALRMFVIYAYQQAKRTIPGVGGSTRIITLSRDGHIKREKSLKVLLVQEFFSKMDHNILSFSPGQGFNRDGGPEKMVREVSKAVLRDIKKLRKQLEQVEKDQSQF